MQCLHTLPNGFSLAVSAPEGHRFISYNHTSGTSETAATFEELSHSFYAVHRVNGGAPVNLGYNIRQAMERVAMNEDVQDISTAELVEASFLASFTLRNNLVLRIETELARRDSPRRALVADCAAFLNKNLAYVTGESQAQAEASIRSFSEERIIQDAANAQNILATRHADAFRDLYVGKIIPEPVEVPEIVEEERKPGGTVWAEVPDPIVPGSVVDLGATSGEA